MITPLRSARSGAGASAYAQYRAAIAEGRSRRLLIRAGLVVAAAVVTGLAWGWLAALVVAVAVGVADTVYRWRTHEAVRTWRQGAIGERRTARMLRPLERRGYTVLHDRALPYGRANVDHLVIGATGVYIVDSKHWSRERRLTRRGRYVRVGRTSGDRLVQGVVYERQAVAAALAQSLGRPVEVTPVLAIHGTRMPLLRVTKVEGVPLLQAPQVRGWISRQPAQLSAEQVAQLATVAERVLPPYTAR
ncbi:nuclease-related domain-containing protein [Streptosporangium saharense]|uniref:nuclease-related domain-containing protein n=1 Tax=Streptosporangium saharense TaxID=1706840 RepID=UPI00331BA804